MLARGGSREMTYSQIADALYPLAGSVDVQVDKEMSTFYGATHIDNLDAYYRILRAMLLDPGWREDDFERIRENAVNAIRAGLRSNDEELAKEALYADIYHDTVYGHYTGGTVSSLQALTLEDVKHFYRSQYSQSHLVLGLAGGYPPEFLEALKKDFRGLPEGSGFRPRGGATEAKMIDNTRVVIVDKHTGHPGPVALSIGFPISVNRNHPDYAALLLAAGFLGQHSASFGVLFQEMREKRGLNYGDYAYIEYFPRGMFRMEPDPNLARHHQIFQLWIRPVEPQTAVFSLRLALYDLDRFVRGGISDEDFQRARDFLTRHLNVLTRTKSAELGYAMDSLYFDQPNYREMVRTALAKLTRDQVNSVIKRYLRTNRVVIAAVCSDAKALQRQLVSGDPSPITYNSPKPETLLEEDKTVEKWPLDLSAENVTVVSSEQVFQ
jgi:zinc protease